MWACRGWSHLTPTLPSLPASPGARTAHQGSPRLGALLSASQAPPSRTRPPLPIGECSQEEVLGTCVFGGPWWGRGRHLYCGHHVGGGPGLQPGAGEECGPHPEAQLPTPSAAPPRPDWFGSPIQSPCLVLVMHCHPGRSAAPELLGVAAVAEGGTPAPLPPPSGAERPSWGGVGQGLAGAHGGPVGRQDLGAVRTGVLELLLLLRVVQVAAHAPQLRGDGRLAEVRAHGVHDV